MPDFTRMQISESQENLVTKKTIVDLGFPLSHQPLGLDSPTWAGGKSIEKLRPKLEASRSVESRHQLLQKKGATGLRPCAESTIFFYFVEVLCRLGSFFTTLSLFGIFFPE